MFRSPIILFLLLFLLFSCKDTSKTGVVAKTKKVKTANSLQARKFLDLADKFNQKQAFHSAYYFYNRSKIGFETEKDSASISYNLIQMATIQQVAGDYFGSEKNLTEALSYIKRGSPYETAIYNLLGISSKELFNYDDALYYYDKAKKTNNNILSSISIENNKAAVHIQKKEYGISIQLLEAVLKFKILDSIETKKARVLDNLGYAYYKANRNIEGLKLMNQALQLRENNNDSFGIIASYLHLSDCFQKYEPQKAKEYALKAYQKTFITNSVTERLESLSFLIQNDLENGKKYALNYIKLNDSLIKSRNKAKNQFAKIKYDSDFNRAENIKLSAQKIETELELEQQKNNNLLMYFIIIVLFGITALIIAFITAFLKIKNKKEKIKATYDTETRISKQLHDELANDVYHTMAFAETQDLATENNKEILLNNLDNIYSRTRNISKENSIIDIGSNYVPHLKEMMSNFSNDSVNILVNGLEIMQNTSLESHKKVTVFRIIQELFVNMKKHSQCSLVVIIFKKIDGKIQIEYTDNGIGPSTDKINLKNGLQNVENRISAINGTITFDNTINKGFNVSFLFPI